MYYFGIGLTFCVISVVLCNIWLRIDKNLELLRSKEYLKELGILAVSTISPVLIMLFTSIEGNLGEAGCFQYLKVIISSGFHVIIIMIIANFLLSHILEKKGQNKNQQMEESQDIVTIYSLNIIACMIISWLYLKSSEMFFTYFSVLLGKFIWFDGINFLEKLGEIKIRERVEFVCDHHFLVFVCTILIWIMLFLGVCRVEKNGMKAVYEAYAAGLGVGAGGFGLIIQDKITKRIK